MNKAIFLEEMTRYLGRWSPVNVEELAPFIVAFQSTCPKQPIPELHKELLGPDPDPARIYIGAPNRAGVEHNLRQSIRGFEESFSNFQKIETGHPLSNWRDLLRLNLQHLTGAGRYFSNGQATATCVILENGQFSLALHDEQAMEDFLSSYAYRPSMAAERLLMLRTEDEARELAIKWLSTVKEQQVAIRVQGQPDTMTWRTWGWIPGPNGYRISGLVLTVRGRAIWTELNEWCAAKFAPYAVLNRLVEVFPGVEADTCATCLSFRFSGMSRDMTGDWGGYCFHGYTPGPSVGSPPAVVVSARCDHHKVVLDAHREHSYLQI